MRGTAELSGEVLGSVEEGQRAAIESAGRFLVTVELTPSQKATRAVVYSRFRDVIDSLHE